MYACPRSCVRAYGNTSVVAVLARVDRLSDSYPRCHALRMHAHSANRGAAGAAVGHCVNPQHGVALVNNRSRIEDWKRRSLVKLAARLLLAIGVAGLAVH